MTKEHVDRIRELLMEISFLPGFPVDEEKFKHFATAYAEFADTSPRTHFKLSPEKPIVPAEWLIETIRKTRKFCPMPAEARATYCGYFTPLDGVIAYEEEKE